MTDKLSQFLATRPWILADGATGTNLFALGLEHGDAPERWNLEETDKVKAHYRSFIDAGSDLVLTNTFGGTANRLKLHQMQDQVHEINAEELIYRVVKKSGAEALLCPDGVAPARRAPRHSS